MVAFEAATVMAMLAIVESSVGVLGWFIVRNMATEEDIDEVEQTAEEAAREAAEARRVSEQAHDRLDAHSVSNR